MRRNLYVLEKRVIMTEAKKAKQTKVCDAKLEGLNLQSMAASCGNGVCKQPCRNMTGYYFEKRYRTKSSLCRVLEDSRQMHLGAGKVVHRSGICEMAKLTLKQEVA